MTRLLLRALNFPALLLLTAIGIAIQTSLFYSWLPVYLQPDVILIVVIWCALRRDFIEGGVMTLFIAQIGELHSAAPQGLFLISYMLIYLGVKTASRILVIPNLNSYVMTTLFAIIAWKLSVLGILSLLGDGSDKWGQNLLHILPIAAVESAFGFWAYRWLDRFDWVTFKAPRAAQASEEEIQLESEGF